MKITIQESKSADTRSCDVTKVSKEVLLAASHQHIGDVKKGLAFFSAMLGEAAAAHDSTKLSDIDWFFSDFKTGFKTTGWWDKHRKVERHHIGSPDGIRDDVNLVDVMEYIVDCVMAGKARTGTVFPLTLPDAVLQKAFKNTADLLANNVEVDKP